MFGGQEGAGLLADELHQDVEEGGARLQRLGPDGGQTADDVGAVLHEEGRRAQRRQPRRGVHRAAQFDAAAAVRQQPLDDAVVDLPRPERELDEAGAAARSRRRTIADAAAGAPNGHHLIEVINERQTEWSSKVVHFLDHIHDQRVLPHEIISSFQSRHRF